MFYWSARLDSTGAQLEVKWTNDADIDGSHIYNYIYTFISTGWFPSIHLLMHKSWDVTEYEWCLQVILSYLEPSSWKLQRPSVTLEYLRLQQLLAKIDQHLLSPILFPLRLGLLKGNFPLVGEHPFFYKSMIEIVCDNRHSNWADQNDKRAKNRLNTIYNPLKRQRLQESVKE